jgi:hypothetical protein
VVDSVDIGGRGGVRGRGERGGATSFNLAFLAVEVEGVDIEQERFFGAFSVGRVLGGRVLAGRVLGGRMLGGRTSKEPKCNSGRHYTKA